MTHSHLPARHLIKQLETHGRPPRDIRPKWLAEMIEEVADLFDPFAEVGRVGFECHVDRNRWNVSMFLGSTERVGGRLDGRVQNIEFQFDVLRLSQLLVPIRRLEWTSFPGNGSEGEYDCSYLAVDADYRDQPIRLRIFGTPPRAASPGLRQLADGTVETL